MSKKITKRTIDQLSPSGRDVLLWDSEIKGFGFGAAQPVQSTMY
jgi:hypothetical protein